MIFLVRPFAMSEIVPKALVSWEKEAFLIATSPQVQMFTSAWISSCFASHCLARANKIKGLIALMSDYGLVCTMDTRDRCTGTASTSNRY